MGNHGAVEGKHPDRTPQQGAASILAAADKAAVGNGSFTSDGKPMDWVVPPSL